MSVRARIIRTMQAGAFGQFVTVVSQLASVPLFLHFWGVERFGEWVIISAIPAYLALSDMGFASAAANDMTMARANGDVDGVISTYRNTLLLLSLISVALILVSPILGLFIVSGSLIDIRTVDANEVFIVIGVLAIGTALSLITNLVSAIYRCEGNFHRAVLFSNLIRLAEFSVTAICLICGGNILTVTVAIVAARGVGLTIMYIHAIHLYRWAIPRFEYSGWGVARRLLRPAISFMAFPVGFAITLQGFVILVGVQLGASAVVAFTTMRTLARVAGQVVGIVAISVWPELSAAFGRNDMALAREIHRRAFQMTLCSVVVSIVALALLGDVVIAIWTGGTVAIQHETFYLLLAGLAINSLWLTSSVVASAKNRHESISIFFLCASAFGLIVCAGLTGRFGIVGTAAAALVVECIMAVLVLPRALALTDDNMPEFLSAIRRFPFSSKSPGGI